jgi:murein DD-endopeptidase MepM/ murein hydrolase activator NlpD
MISVLLLVAALGVVAPVPGPVIRGFEAPPSPYAAGHRGVDLAAAPGEEVRAALPGLVTFSGLVAGKGWVTVRHEQAAGGLETTYGDLDPRIVAAGDRVKAGQPLGLLDAAADHLDWGARLDGRYIDPLALLGQWEVHLVREEAGARPPPAHWAAAPAPPGRLNAPDRIAHRGPRVYPSPSALSRDRWRARGAVFYPDPAFASYPPAVGSWPPLHSTSHGACGSLVVRRAMGPASPATVG